MNPRVLELAKEAGMVPKEYQEIKGDIYILRVWERFYLLAQTEAHEEDARLCDAEASGWRRPKYAYAEAVGMHCAKRARELATQKRKEAE